MIEPVPAASPRGAAAPFALHDGNFRWFWAGLVSFTHALTMYRFLVPWLAFEVSGSTLVLGWVALATALPGLLALPYASVSADRVDRARLLRMTQSFATVLAIVLAALLITGVFEVWHLVALALVMSVTHAFDQPARASIVPALVSGPALVSAFALSSAAWNLAQILGPALSGALIAVAVSMGAGPGAIFLLVAGGFALTAFTMTRVRVSATPAAGPRRLWSTEFAEGVRFTVRRPEVRAIMLAVFATGTFGASYAYLMPAFAKDIYAVDARGLGILVSSVGVGALIGTTLLARFGGEGRRGALFLGATFAFGAVLLAFSMSRSFPVAIPLLVAAGALSATYLTVGQTLLASLTPDPIRGRVMGLFALTFTMQGVGAALGGAVAAVVGPPVAVALGAVILATAVSVVTARTPELRRLA